VLPLLYPHGLSTLDFAPALEQLLGSGQGLSAPTVARLTAQWQDEAKAVAARDLSQVEFVYLWVDGKSAGCSSKSSARSPSSLMSERTRDGLAAARARGRVGGPKLKLRPRQAELARQMYEIDEQGHNKFTVAQIAAEFGVSRPTIYRYLD